jgi:hypothetical protein
MELKEIRRWRGLKCHDFHSKFLENWSFNVLQSWRSQLNEGTDEQMFPPRQDGYEGGPKYTIAFFLTCG